MTPLPQLDPTRAEVNRQNSQHSTGPKTPEGKNRIRFNAVKHNLSGKDLLLQPSETAAYNELNRKLHASWNPVTEEETDVLLAIIDSQWRLNGIPALHANLLAVATQEHMDQYDEVASNPEQQLSMARVSGYRTNQKLFEQFSRHEVRLQRTIAALTARLMNLLDYRERIEQEQRAARQIAALNLLKQPIAKQSQPAPAVQTAKQSQPAPATDQEPVEAELCGNNSTRR
jgi:hypothetical protein